MTEGTKEAWRNDTDDRNRNQIIRVDARNCFVESLSDAFEIGKAHLAFTAYDLKRPVKQRQTDSVHIYIGMAGFLELCRKLSCGELRYMMQEKRRNKDSGPLQEWLGGTSAEKMFRYGRAREDGMSLSRIARLFCGERADFLFVADSGPGEQNEKGLIVPRFGKNPENHVSVSMNWESLSGLLLLTKTHYEAWLAAWYARRAPGC